MREFLLDVNRSKQRCQRLVSFVWVSDGLNFGQQLNGDSGVGRWGQTRDSGFSVASCEWPRDEQAAT